MKRPPLPAVDHGRRGRSPRRALPRAAALVGLCALVSSCGEIPVEDATFPPRGNMSGVVVYSGPPPCVQNGHVVGAAVLLVFNTDLLPPPEGFGTSAAQLGVVAGDVLFQGIAGSLAAGGAPNANGVVCPPEGSSPVTVSAPFQLGPLNAGRFQIRAFYDYDGQFSPVLKLHELPTAGDIGGGAIANVAEVLAGAPVRYQSIEIGRDLDGNGRYTMPSTGVTVDGVSVTLGLQLTLSRPVFYYDQVADERPTTGLDGTGAPIVDMQSPPQPVVVPPLTLNHNPPTGVVMAQDEQFVIAPPNHPDVADAQFLRLKLHAGLPDAETATGVSRPYFLQVVPPYNKIWVFAGLDASGSVLQIPEKSPTPIASLFPQAIFGMLDDADPRDQTAQASPAVILNGITLAPLGTLLDTAAQSFTDADGKLLPPQPVDELTVALRPSVLCLNPFDVNAQVTLVTPAFAALDGEVVVDPADLIPKLRAQLGNRPNVNVIEGCLPTGRLQANLVYPTGQAWTLPNEAGRCMPLETPTAGEGACQQSGLTRTVLSSQSTVLRIGPPRDPAFCKKFSGKPGYSADGVPLVCLPVSKGGAPPTSAQLRPGRAAPRPPRGAGPRAGWCPGRGCSSRLLNVETDWVRGASALERSGRQTLVAIGNFDGVHRGHHALLRDALAWAGELDLMPVVLTFEPHPAVALGRAAPPTLTPLARKAALLRALSPALRVVVQTFDAPFAAQSPGDFAAKLLREGLSARAVVVGQNFRFGHHRSGDFDALRALGEQLGFEVLAAPLVGDARGLWSSTRVRGALAAGDLGDAADVLGRPYEIEAEVVTGQRRGRTLGFPTANLGPSGQAMPANGVYVVEVLRVTAPGEHVAERLGDGVANIGVRPTLAAGFAVEVHVLDFDGDLYGARLRVRVLGRLREERTFSSLDALRAQIAVDAGEARAQAAALRERAGSSTQLA